MMIVHVLASRQVWTVLIKQCMQSVITLLVRCQSRGKLLAGSGWVQKAAGTVGMSGEAIWMSCLMMSV